MIKILLPQNLILKFSFFAALFFISISVTAQKEVALANTYLKENVGKYNLTSNDIADMQVSSQYLSPTTGWYHIYFNQAFKNVEVLNSLIGITIQNNKVVNTASNFINNLSAKIENKNTAAILTPTLALQKVLTYNIGNTYNTNNLREKENDLLINGTLNKIIFEDKSISNENIIVKKYWLPVEENFAEKNFTRVVLIWNVKYYTKDGKHSWSVHVDANTGSVLQKIDEVVHCDFGTPHFTDCTQENKFDSSLNTIQKNSAAPFANGYNVFDYPIESPNHGARTLVSNPYTRFLPATMGPGTTNGWHNDGTTNYTNTRGNSVWAKDDIANDNETTIGSSPTSATLDFNDPYSQTTASAAANLNAAVTNLFYWNNVIHDVLWRYGFDEPSGNFQKDNMGKGGAGNDFVYADAQDGSGTNNANFSTPADGGNGRMQMFIWSNAGSPSYQPDSDFDNGVIGHEYGHGWSIRLAGGPANSGCLQNAEQGGEGWGDYNGLMLTTNWANLTPTIASANIPKGIGTYVYGQNPATGAGIRPYRYSYDKATYNNVVTYGKVADVNFSQPHGIGSIWATILWDMTWEIILQDNFIAPNIYDVPTVITNMRGNIAAYKLVNEGLRLQACSPSFVQARDAIFQADLLLFGGRYRCAIGKAFARRGLGLNASTGVSTNDRIVTEDFTPFPGPAISSPVNNIICSKQIFNYTATVASVGAYTFAWTRPVVVGISNAAGSGSTATINETLINTTNSPITVTYLITVSPDECGGTPAAQRVRVIVNPSVTPTVALYNICQNGTVPAGQGLVAPIILTKVVDGTIVAGTPYNRGTGTTTYVAAIGGAQGTSVYFKTYSFVSPINASVSFYTTAANLGGSDDSYLALYQNSFDPANPGINFLIADDDAGVGALSLITQTLSVGTTYIVVVSSYTNNLTGTFTLEASTEVFTEPNNWYTTASGGTVIASTNIFNPVGVAGSGIANTTIAGTTTFYVANSLFPTCRTATTFTIAPTTIYVNQSNTGGTYNGNSWATAYTNLQDALNNYSPACTPIQIWVAAGTYKPTSTTDRNISFSMKNNVAIYGGFANTGNPTFTQRNVVDNITILSGDIGIANNNTDNSYHVISNTEGLTNTAILDGFTITNGKADVATNFKNIGAGIYNDAGTTGGTCNPKIDNCIFVNNIAMLNGGAIYNKAQNSNASPTITNCIFTNNTAVDGAAIYTDAQAAGTSSPIITNCTFTNNSASSNGSVLYANNVSGTANPSFTNCILWGNAGSKSLFVNNATINLKYSMVEPLVSNYVNGAGNITSTLSPFVSSTNFRIKESSTGIDAGTTVGAPTTDATLANRIVLPDMGALENIQCCNGFNKIYFSDIVGDTYQWQINNGGGFVNITNGALFANTNTNKLTVLNPAFATTGNIFRCVVTTNSVSSFSSEITLRFYNRWLGTVDNNWLNTANWACGIIPNQYTDVIIPSAKTIYPLVNVGGTVRTLQTETGSNVTVTAGNNLVIVGQ